MSAAHVWFVAFLTVSALLTIALGGNVNVVKENRRLRTELARAKASKSTALHIAGKHRMHPAHVRINRANAQDAMTHGQGDAS